MCWGEFTVSIQSSHGLHHYPYLMIYRRSYTASNDVSARKFQMITSQWWVFHRVAMMKCILTTLVVNPGVSAKAWIIHVPLDLSLSVLP